MKTRVLSVFTVVLLAAVGAAAQQQTSFNDVYQVSYYANSNNVWRIDQPVRIVNPGMQGTPLLPNEGNVCANLYVFDANQTMQECCSCAISANGVLTLSLLNNLLQNPANGSIPSSGVIKIVSSEYTDHCDATQISPVPNLRASMEHLEVIPSRLRAVFFLNRGTPIVSRAAFEDSTLLVHEQTLLQSSCGSIVSTNACTCGSGG